MKWKLLILSLVCFSLGAILGRLGTPEPSNEPDLESVSEPVFTSQCEPIQVQDKNAASQLRQENLALVSELKRLEHALQAAQASISVHEPESFSIEQDKRLEQEQAAIAQQMFDPELILSQSKLELSPALAELTLVLKLDEYEQQELRRLLQQKVEQDIEATLAFNKASFLGDYDEVRLGLEEAKVEQVLLNNQHHYLQALEGFLSQEKIADYRKWEYNKLNEQRSLFNEYEKVRLFAQFPELDEFQKQEITRLLAAPLDVEKDTLLGVQGSSSSMAFLYPQVFDYPYKQIEALLNPEQLRIYRGEYTD